MDMSNLLFLFLQKALSSHHSSVTFHDYCINDQGGDIYEILMIMKLYTGIAQLD